MQCNSHRNVPRILYQSCHLGEGEGVRVTVKLGLSEKGGKSRASGTRTETQRRFPKTNEEVRPLLKMSEEPSKHLTVFSSETVSIKKLTNLTANTKNYGQIRPNIKPHSNPLKRLFWKKYMNCKVQLHSKGLYQQIFGAVPMLSFLQTAWFRFSTYLSAIFAENSSRQEETFLQTNV